MWRYVYSDTVSRNSSSLHSTSLIQHLCFILLHLMSYHNLPPWLSIFLSVTLARHLKLVLAAPQGLFESWSSPFLCLKGKSSSQWPDCCHSCALPWQQLYTSGFFPRLLSAQFPPGVTLFVWAVSLTMTSHTHIRHCLIRQQGTNTSHSGQS